MNAIMTLAWALVVPLVGQSEDPNALISKVRAAVQENSYASLEVLFDEKEYMLYLRTMAEASGGLNRLSVSAMPVPVGYEKTGSHWVIFHKYQQLEQHHDVVVPIIRTGEGLKLGKEIPEDIATDCTIESLNLDVQILPKDQTAKFRTIAKIRRSGDKQSVLMRMNDVFRITKAEYNGKEIQVQWGKDPKDFTINEETPKLMQCGGVVVLVKPENQGDLLLEYLAKINIPRLDHITDNSFLFTSYWYPHIGRQPMLTRTTITGPEDWLLMGNGNKISESKTGISKTIVYEMPFPISWIHVVGGNYTLAAETSDRGRTYRAWHRTRINPERGKRDVEMAKDSVAFFEDRFGKFPFNGYDIIDTEFYGVECYSFTVLSPQITSWATSHEIGHTYFGGIVPSTYIHSTWNESVTQYVDSVLFKNNSDQTLQNGWNLRSRPAPLSSIYWAHGPDGHVSYFRGAYTMKMLEHEIGSQKMIECLKTLCEKQKGKVTDWNDLQKVFSENTKTDLGWFFEQWVYNAKFPRLQLISVTTSAANQGFRTIVTLRQENTTKPFKLKFEIVLETSSGMEKTPVAMSQERHVFEVFSKARPTQVSINCFGWSLAEPPPAFPVNG